MQTLISSAASPLVHGGGGEQEELSRGSPASMSHFLPPDPVASSSSEEPLTQ